MEAAKVLYTNVCSLHNKLDELWSITGSADIIGLTETWLCQDEEIALGGFTTYSTPRGTRMGGGCALLIRSHYAQGTRELFSHADNIQCSVCDVRLEAEVRIICVYRSPGAGPREDSQFLIELRQAIAGHRNWVVMGDFNAPDIDWAAQHTTSPNGFGRQLLDLMQDAAAYQHVREPTRFREGHRPSTLDLVFTQYEGDLSGVASSNPLGKSDHVVIHMNLLLKRCRPPPQWCRDYNKMKAEDVTRHACEMSWAGNSVSEKWARIRDNLELLLATHVPLRRKLTGGSRPWYKGRVKRRLRRKAQAWAAYRRCPSQAMYRRYKAVRNSAISCARQARVKFERRLATRATTNPKSFYGYVQSQVRLRKEVGRSFNHADTTVSDDADIAELFVAFFASVFREDRGSNPPAIQYDTPESGMGRVNFEKEEIERALGRLKTFKAAGPDGIHPRLVRTIATAISQPVTDLFNQSLNDCEIPQDWKEAIVVPIHKNGDPRSVSNYRPVSLTSIIAKVMERSIRDKICRYLMQHDLINPVQHGFVTGRSCLTNLLVSLDAITEALDRGDRVMVGYLDFEKAFDSVNHRLLLLKLKAYGLEDHLCAWLGNFLQHRMMRVKVRESLSDPIEPRSGVPQGTVLGPLLFLIYVNDLTVGLNSKCLLFADDVKVIGVKHDWVRFQEDLEKLAEWSRHWDLPLNPRKSQLMVSTGFPEDKIAELGDASLGRAPHVKDLGVILDSTFKPSTQCIEAANKARRALFALKRSVVSRDRSVWVPLYCAFVRPHLEYCVQAWAPYLAKDADILERVQKLATKWVAGLETVSYEERLKQLNLFSLARRRLRGDLIEVFRMTKGLSGIRLDDLLSRHDGRPTRGHDYKLKKERSRLELRKNFFTQRVVTPWNQLPADVVGAPSITIFKKKLDDCWDQCFPHMP